jgi:hypothetical protein
LFLLVSILTLSHIHFFLLYTPTLPSTIFSTLSNPGETNSRSLLYH